MKQKTKRTQKQKEHIKNQTIQMHQALATGLRALSAQVVALRARIQALEALVTFTVVVSTPPPLPPPSFPPTYVPRSATGDSLPDARPTTVCENPPPIKDWMYGR